MRKIKHYLAVVCLVCLFMPCLGVAKSNPKRVVKRVNVEATYKRDFAERTSDSIADIVFGAKRIVLVKDSVTYVVPRYQHALLMHILSDKGNYETDIPVFAHFSKYATIKFINGKKSVCLSVDCGTKKWLFEGADGKELCRYNLFSAEIFRYLHAAFPNDSLLSETVKNFYL